VGPKQQQTTATTANYSKLQQLQQLQQKSGLADVGVYLLYVAVTLAL
jgi:hypothetical protein